MRTKLNIVAIAGLLSLVSAQAFAQDSTTGAVRGEVKDVATGESAIGATVVIDVEMAADIRRYLADTRPMIEQLTPEHAAAVHEAERTGHFDAPAYAAANEEFTAQHITRHLTPETQPYWDRTDAGAGMESYIAMDGQSEFSITGNLQNYERENDLHRITIPLLYISGEFDTCTEGASREYASKSPHAEVAVIARSGHCKLIDQPEATIAVTRAFLNRVEAA